MVSISSVAAFLFGVAFAHPIIEDTNTASTAAKTQCRYLPGDKAWPNQNTWNELNRTVGGRLIAGKPLAQPCYGSDITASDAARCTELQNEWTELSPL